MQELELEMGLVLFLQPDGVIGVQNIGTVAEYGGRVVGKCRKWWADREIDIGEGFGLFRLAREGVRKWKSVDLDTLKREFEDMTQGERRYVIGRVKTGYNNARNEDEAELSDEQAEEVFATFIENQLSNIRLFHPAA